MRLLSYAQNKHKTKRILSYAIVQTLKKYNCTNSEEIIKLQKNRVWLESRESKTINWHVETATEREKQIKINMFHIKSDI